MNSRINRSLPHPPAPPSEGASQALDRRRFLQCTAGAGAILGLGATVFGEAQLADSSTAGQSNPAAASGGPPLSDGTEYVPWERPLTFSKTYYVDNNSPRANDNGPGTRERPFRTINKAAQVLQPGERVVIASGVYRECVRPLRGGTDPTAMISYEAAPGAKVAIKGSEVLQGGWQEGPVSMFRPRPQAQGNQGAASATQAPQSAPPPGPPVLTWHHELTAANFPDGYNPFALASAPADRSWLDTARGDGHGI